MELLIPTDAEVAALDELSEALPVHGFPGITKAAQTLGTKIPTSTTKPDEFGRVVGVGGAGRDLVTDSPLLTLEAFAKKEQRARDLCALMVAIIERAARAGTLGGAVIYAARIVGLPANLPHPQVPDRFRFTATVSVDLRRTTA
ncbi:conserved hypothetical protein [Microbacterium sp. 8M]|uniref:hypothetical protein n=1 Tax=Microbacterium sp. 8M TaxID=2653153 RepID=UPI0012F3648B|nr:hypothetical protein [Microbacterium sp. 8M]VXC30705.1 conserved hypothetical protein [Microbacterium sp. 8M]